jgi:hypothetical protein
MIFQMDMAHSLMEKGLLMDCPEVANFMKPKLRPKYSRKNEYHPCENDNFFFCKYRITLWSAAQEAQVTQVWSPSPWIARVPSGASSTKSASKQGIANEERMVQSL